MKKLLLFVFGVCVMLPSYAQQSATLQRPDMKALEKTLTASQVPAISMMLIENGQQEWLSSGKDEKGREVNLQTVFDVASLTKSVTTLLTLKLVEAGAWNLDAPLHPYWTDPDVSDDPFHKKLTTRHILSHRSGFANWRWMNESNQLVFEFEPGTQFKYSGEGFEYLRKALENKFNKSFEQLADSLVFQPLGMQHSALVWNEKMNQMNFAGTFDKEGKLYTYEKAFQANAADNLLTTAEDFGKMSAALLNSSFLDDKTVQEMIRPHSQVREGIDFGLGWIVFKDLPSGEYALFNAGSDQGVNALVVLLPQSKRGMIVFTNGDNGRQLAMQMVAKVLGETGQSILSRF